MFTCSPRRRRNVEIASPFERKPSISRTLGSRGRTKRACLRFPTPRPAAAARLLVGDLLLRSPRGLVLGLRRLLLLLLLQSPAKPGKGREAEAGGVLCSGSAAARGRRASAAADAPPGPAAPLAPAALLVTQPGETVAARHAGC